MLRLADDVEFLLVAYLYSSTGQPSGTTLIMEASVGVHMTVWGYVDSLLFLYNEVQFCVNCFIVLQGGSFLLYCYYLPTSLSATTHAAEIPTSCRVQYACHTMAIKITARCFLKVLLNFFSLFLVTDKCFKVR